MRTLPALPSANLHDVERAFYALGYRAAATIRGPADITMAAAENSNRMPPIHTQLAPLELLTDRWLIEALSQLSSNPRVRDAAATWLAAYRGALERGFAEDDAQARADEALQRTDEAWWDAEEDSHTPDRPGRLPGGPTRG